MSIRPASGRRWTAFAQSVIDRYAGTCHVCGHGGARQVDHLEPVTERPDLVYAMGNCRPAHGSPGNPCTQCTRDCGRSIYCNQLRGGYSAERARRIIAELAAAYAAGQRTGTRTPRVRGAGSAEQSREEPGRAWLGVSLDGGQHLQDPPAGLVIRPGFVLADHAVRLITRRHPDQHGGLVVPEQIMRSGNEPADSVHEPILRRQPVSAV